METRSFFSSLSQLWERGYIHTHLEFVHHTSLCLSLLSHLLKVEYHWWNKSSTSCILGMHTILRLIHRTGQKTTQGFIMPCISSSILSLSGRPFPLYLSALIKHGLTVDILASDRKCGGCKGKQCEWPAEPATTYGLMYVRYWQNSTLNTLVWSLLALA